VHVPLKSLVPMVEPNDIVFDGKFSIILFKTALLSCQEALSISIFMLRLL